MPRTPFDLTFEDLTEAGAQASAAAWEEAKRAGVAVATLDAPAPRFSPQTGWTEERLELLEKLWQDGLSASQIAKQLGGVTRNAVIAKVHGLGLSGRTTPSKPARTVFKAPRPARPVPAGPSAPQPPTPVRYVDETPGTATVLTLGAHMCKWPIGDPSTDNFTFCGRRSGDGLYCQQHAAVAYQLAEPTERSTPVGQETGKAGRRPKVISIELRHRTSG